ncbi:hypothetical protein IFM12275_30550 [Nocardia sputorum]|nr:hypothetical protein IFM12275_30550 [Nocardia sputorum]
MCSIAANGVRHAEQLLDSGSYTDQIGKALTSAGAEMMTVAGWVHYDAGRWAEARRYYADAAQAATAASDGIAAAHAWVNACLLSHREGSRPKEGVRWPKPPNSPRGAMEGRCCERWRRFVKRKRAA